LASFLLPVDLSLPASLSRHVTDTSHARPHDTDTAKNPAAQNFRFAVRALCP
jgi:hypothetical protein